MAQSARVIEEDATRKGSEPKPLVGCRPGWRVRVQMGMLRFKEDMGVFACEMEERMMGKSNYSWDGGPGGRCIICRHCKAGSHHRWRRDEGNLQDDVVEYEANEVDEFGDPIWLPVEMANEDQDQIDGFAVVYQAQIT